MLWTVREAGPYKGAIDYLKQLAKSEFRKQLVMVGFADYFQSFCEAKYIRFAFCVLRFAFCVHKVLVNILPRNSLQFIHPNAFLWGIIIENRNYYQEAPL